MSSRLCLYGFMHDIMTICGTQVAVAGAPVSQWELYDTAYTERYMGEHISLTILIGPEVFLFL